MNLEILLRLIKHFLFLLFLAALFLLKSQSAYGHDNVRGTCTPHIPNQWNSCGGPNRCIGPDVVNDWEVCFIEADGVTHTGCYTIADDLHQANAPQCAPPEPTPTPTKNCFLGECPIENSKECFQLNGKDEVWKCADGCWNLEADCKANNQTCVNNSCVATPTPTPLPAPTATSTPYIPPSPGASATPTGTPMPNASPAPTRTSTPAISLIPNSSATPTRNPTLALTPTPTFNPAACKCDGIESTAIFSGADAEITSFAKVEGTDVSKAKVQDQKFFLAEGAETSGVIIARSGPIPATIISIATSKVRYQSKWLLTIPQLKPGATYRIWSQINCQQKASAQNFSPGAASVLAEATNDLSFFDKILDFIAKIFIKPQPTPIQSGPTAAPTSSQSKIIPSQAPSSLFSTTERKSLQLEPMYPAEIYQKTCSFIKFRYDPTSP